MAEDKSNPVSGQKSVKDAEFKVVSPLGEATVKQITMVPRLDTLEGKTICSVKNNSFKSWVTGPLYEKLLTEKYPTVKVIPNTEMPIASKAPAPGKTDERTDAMIAAFKEKGCDAVIVGNGG
jgi:hypothetical protein